MNLEETSGWYRRISFLFGNLFLAVVLALQLLRVTEGSLFGFLPPFFSLFFQSRVPSSTETMFHKTFL